MLPNGPDPRPASLDEAPPPPATAAVAAVPSTSEAPADGPRDPGLRSLIVLVAAVIALAVVYFVIR